MFDVIFLKTLWDVVYLKVIVNLTLRKWLEVPDISHLVKGGKLIVGYCYIIVLGRERAEGQARPGCCLSLEGTKYITTDVVFTPRWIVLAQSITNPHYMR